MRHDLYQAETARIAAEQAAMLDDVHARLIAGGSLSNLEQNGVLHAWQVLIENCIGKAKHCLKAYGEPVPVSAYDAFATLNRLGLIDTAAPKDWNAAIGLRNRIVHDYMDIILQWVMRLVVEQRYRLLVTFCNNPFQQSPN
jgi:uncharacterized protein YutE (UPF0331/DUF86 family)